MISQNITNSVAQGTRVEIVAVSTRVYERCKKTYPTGDPRRMFWALTKLYESKTEADLNEMIDGDGFLAYYLFLSLPPATRYSSEREVLDEYLATLPEEVEQVILPIEEATPLAIVPTSGSVLCDEVLPPEGLYVAQCFQSVSVSDSTVDTGSAETGSETTSQVFEKSRASSDYPPGSSTWSGLRALEREIRYVENPGVLNFVSECYGAFCDGQTAAAYRDRQQMQKFMRDVTQSLASIQRFLSPNPQGTEDEYVKMKTL